MIIKHMKSDPNATIHAWLGFAGFALVLIVCFAFTEMRYMCLAYAQVAAFVVGIVIELVQRWQRRRRVNGKLVFSGEGQNSTLESVLDVMQTGLFYVTYYVNRGKEAK